MNSNIPLTVDDNPDAHDVRFLEDRINRYNVAHTGIGDGRELAIVVRDGEGIAAGLYGFTWARVLEVKLLWVREDMRGQGHGTNLLAAAEQEAIERGCVQALLDTHTFQAPGFYQQRGYEIYGVADEYPPGHSKVFLRKRLVKNPGEAR